MHFPLNIALAQLNPTVGDVAGNAKIALGSWNNHQNVDLIVFPELFLSGYPPEDLVLKPSFMDAIEHAVNDILDASKEWNAAALLPTPWRIKNKIYNAALLIQHGKIIEQTLKRHLPNYGVFDEKRVFEPGPLPEPMMLNGHKLGVMVCEDMWFQDVAAHLTEQGAEILIVPNGSPFSLTKQDERMDHAGTRVSETGLPLIYVNQVGGQDEVVFDGASFALDQDCNTVAVLPSFENIVQTLKDNSAELPAPMETFYHALKLGLRDYVRKNGFKGVLIGMSGGIDSAMAATIAADALGPENVSCVMMPSPFTSQDSLDDARECAELLGVSYDMISIEKAMQAFEETIPNLGGVAHENMQSRARGLILMALSNSTGQMVLSTGNKSEMAVGYATLYGDMCGGYNVLKDVYKTQVYDLAHWRNDKSAAIPERIITKAPTAELREDQKDEDSLPDYDTLDKILIAFIEDEKSLSDIIGMGFDEETVKKVQRLLYLAEYKRRQAPPGPKITNRAFGRERRYPITNGF